MLYNCIRSYPDLSKKNGLGSRLLLGDKDQVPFSEDSDPGHVYLTPDPQLWC